MNSATALVRRLLRRIFETPPDINPAQWAEQYRRMSTDESAIVGRFSFRPNPFFRWLLEQYARPDVRQIICQKPAQIGWTQSVIVVLLGYFVHIKRTTSIVMFPKELAARNFDLEKFRPMVQSTPALSAVLPKSRTADVKTLFKKFSGGFIKFVGSNSISDVKSTSARDLIVEEPDDCNLNLKGQGDAIKLLAERGKTYRDVKMLIGGTPSIEGLSSICDAMELSNKTYWEVPCPDCGTYQRLQWGNVEWLKHDEDHAGHPVYGRHRPETARYRCASPECGTLWSNAQKNAAIQRGKPVATQEFRGVIGLYLNELYSAFNESRLERLAERYLEAKHEEAKGNTADLIVFWNACLGLPFRYKGSTPEVDELKAKGLAYRIGVVPAQGLMLTLGCDVQHNRIALTVRAFGVGEESWLVHWAEVPGNTVDEKDPVWDHLERLILRTWRHERGWRIKIRAASVDSGDGQTNDAVYAFVRRMRGKGPVVMATKGSSTASAEVYSKARVSVDTKANGTKAAKYGLRPFMVGTDLAKDLLLGEGGRVKLPGTGPGRFHFPAEVDEEYLRQLTSEVKVPRWDTARGRRIIPSRTARNMLVWVKKPSVRNEVLDCEILCLHAARSQSSHTRKPVQWQALEAELAQQLLIDAPASVADDDADLRAPIGAADPDDATDDDDATPGSGGQPNTAQPDNPPASVVGAPVVVDPTPTTTGKRPARRQVVTADDPYLQ